MVTAWIDEGVGLVLKERGPSLSGSVTDARDAEHRLKAAWRQVGSQLFGALGDQAVGTAALELEQCKADGLLPLACCVGTRQRCDGQA